MSEIDRLSFKSRIETLPANRNGYAYFEVSKLIVEKLPEKHKTRVICEIDQTLSFQCGFSHLGNGNFYIILSKPKLKKIKKSEGDAIEVNLKVDPNKLGAEIPESILILIEQDEYLKSKFYSLTDGQKRNVIRYVTDTKNIDKQVERIIYMLNKYGK